jgi:hypothetical protein
MSIGVYNHFHKDFPFNWNSKWLFATYAGGKEPFTWHSPDDSKKYLNVNRDAETINDLRHYYSRTTEDDFLKAMGILATEYWLFKNTPSHDYIGAGSYRRYLLLDPNGPKNVAKLSLTATQENAERFGTDEHQEIILEYFKTCDVITNHSIAIPQSVEEQYLMYEPREYWDLFKLALNELYPKYRNHMTWFTHNNIINFETTYIMRREFFLQYVDEFFRIMKFIWENCSEIYPTIQTTSEPLPWRYPGFIGERFFPFFVYANSLKKIQVPLVILE